MAKHHDKLAKILRTSPEVLLGLEQKLDKLTGKSGVIQKIVEENEILVGRTLDELGLTKEERTAEKVYKIMVTRLQHMDTDLFNFLDKPDLSQMSTVCGKLCETAAMLNQPKPGYFIKKDKAVEMLSKFPPQNLLNHFGYSNVQELVEKQGFASVFSALRFAQDTKWMHEFFDKAYDDLTANDFEERDIELKVLESEWLKVAEKFLEKKYHNLSHLKEFGVIFVIPLPIDTPGETMRIFTLMLHYLNEVPFYSKLFRRFAQRPSEEQATEWERGSTKAQQSVRGSTEHNSANVEPDFPTKLKSLLRGDVPEGPLPPAEKNLNVRIVQRYLAKDDEKDFRLAEPHINPEAEHWYKAEGDLGKLAELPEAKGHALGYWQGLDFVGDFFADGEERLVSFDLIDLVMSLVKKGEIKYLYHQEEALWNKIFIEYLGREKVNELVEESIIKGYIEF